MPPSRGLDRDPKRKCHRPLRISSLSPNTPKAGKGEIHVPSVLLMALVVDVAVQTVEDVADVESGVTAVYRLAKNVSLESWNVQDMA
jgi:hypothetical protein